MTAPPLPWGSRLQVRPQQQQEQPDGRAAFGCQEGLCHFLCEDRARVSATLLICSRTGTFDHSGENWGCQGDLRVLPALWGTPSLWSSVLSPSYAQVRPAVALLQAQRAPSCGEVFFGSTCFHAALPFQRLFSCTCENIVVPRSYCLLKPCSNYS